MDLTRTAAHVTSAPHDRGRRAKAPAPFRNRPQGIPKPRYSGGTHATA